MKAASDQATSIAWSNRNMHYIKNLKPLAEYLTPPKSDEQKRNEGAAKVLAMMKRLMRKNEGASENMRP